MKLNHETKQAEDLQLNVLPEPQADSSGPLIGRRIALRKLFLLTTGFAAYLGYDHCTNKSYRDLEHTYENLLGACKILADGDLGKLSVQRVFSEECAKSISMKLQEVLPPISKFISACDRYIDECRNASLNSFFGGTNSDFNQLTFVSAYQISPKDIHEEIRAEICAILALPGKVATQFSQDNAMCCIQECRAVETSAISLMKITDRMLFKV